MTARRLKTAPLIGALLLAVLTLSDARRHRYGYTGRRQQEKQQQHHHHHQEPSLEEIAAAAKLAAKQAQAEAERAARVAYETELAARYGVRLVEPPRKRGDNMEDSVSKRKSEEVTMRHSNAVPSRFPVSRRSSVPDAREPACTPAANSGRQDGHQCLSSSAPCGIHQCSSYDRYERPLLWATETVAQKDDVGTLDDARRLVVTGWGFA
jgi:hypothetical protein